MNKKFTAEEKAKQWLDDTVHGYSVADVKSLAKLLKEQDRATRHACAEAVIAIPSVGMTESLINRDAAHNACMNTKAV
jgi:hypothetical protein